MSRTKSDLNLKASGPWGKAELALELSPRQAKAAFVAALCVVLGLLLLANSSGISLGNIIQAFLNILELTKGN
jgi:hypothetical protein